MFPIETKWQAWVTMVEFKDGPSELGSASATTNNPDLYW